ncbi:putative oxidoreductase [Porphyridium purpureum]|uniref:Putative oxidoreductase n=1 Tax=Porphyridium purpureum TaxID=35688 RepID=A0A5J4YPM6_PORPP|nr:putative oxidoreductase [Porphyridium purpureum]|eukprot:POR8917..scf222_8
MLFISCSVWRGRERGINSIKRAKGLWAEAPRRGRVTCAMGGFMSKILGKNEHVYHETLARMAAMDGKNIVITGTTSGTGYATALACARKGARVYMMNRPSSRAERAIESLRAEVSSELVIQVDCDLMSFASVRAACETVNAQIKDKGIDALVCNAGIMTFPDVRTLDGFDQQMQTNHLSHFLITKLLLPELQKAADLRGEARVCLHTSLSRLGFPLDAKYYRKCMPGTLGGDGLGARIERYHQSKLANVVFQQALADRLGANSNILVLSAAPGFSETNLAATIIQDTRHNVGARLLLQLFGICAQGSLAGASPLLTTACLPVKTRELWEPSHLGRVRGPPRSFSIEKVCLDEEARDVLWEVSEEAIGEKFMVS